MHFPNSVYNMNESNLVTLLEKLKTLTIELEKEIKHDSGSYNMSSEDYTEILKYVQEENKQ